MNKSPAVILADAVEILRRNGHFKGGYFHEEAAGPKYARPVCAVGAILIAAEGTPEPELPYHFGDAAYQAIKVLSRGIHSSVVDSDPVERIADWNDAPERTPVEVLQAMTTAAEEWAA